MNPPPILPSVRIALGQAASDALRASGCDYLIASPQTHPDDPTKYAIHCYNLPDEVAQQVAGILARTHHAVKDRATKTTATDPHP